MARVANEELTSLAVRVLRHEAAAIFQAADRLRLDDVERAAEILLGSRSKVVVLGAGKSGIAGRKIASTLTSTGTAAIFLHPADALHGDIGMVGEGDCAIAVSNSGESDELVAALTHLRRREIPVVAIVGNPESAVARHAHVSLDASVDEEACPLNLAPTTSTTVAIAIGDALAAVVMTAKGFTVEDFALNHPGGRLGKRLTLRVVDLMHTEERNPTISPTAPLIEVIEAITRGGLGAANVVEGSGLLLGIVTDGDLRRAVQRSGFAELERLHAADIMTANPTVVSSQSLAYEALRLMEDRPSQISVLPVVDAERRCLGLLRLHDVIQAGLR